MQCIGGGAIHHKQDAIRLFNLGPSALYADALYGICGFTQAGGVNNVQRHAV